MPRSTTKKATYQARADEAMKAQLARRKELVGAIGAAEERRDNQLAALTEAQQKLDELNDEVLTAYTDAIAGGWTEAELNDLGITKPETKPTKSAKKTTARTATPAPPPTTDTHHDHQPPLAEATDFVNGENAEHTPALTNGGTHP